MTYYVILENGWEYNDEYYYQQISGTNEKIGIPKRVYSSKEMAEEELYMLNNQEYETEVKNNLEYYNINIEADDLKNQIENCKSLKEKYLLMKKYYIDTYSLHEVEE